MKHPITAQQRLREAQDNSPGRIYLPIMQRLYPTQTKFASDAEAEKAERNGCARHGLLGRRRAPFTNKQRLTHRTRHLKKQSGIAAET